MDEIKYIKQQCSWGTCQSKWKDQKLALGWNPKVPLPNQELTFQLLHFKKSPKNIRDGIEVVKETISGNTGWKGDLETTALLNKS